MFFDGQSAEWVVRQPEGTLTFILSIPAFISMVLAPPG